MAYNILIDDLFSSKTATTGGSGANSVGVNGSTGIGVPTTVNTGYGGTSAGWVDFTGNVWEINTGYGGAANAIAVTGGIPANILYRPSAENYENGYVRAWQPAVQSNNSVMVGRFNPASGGSCYAGMVYANDTVFVYKVVNGTPTQLVSGAAWASGTPITTGAAVHEVVLSQTDSTHTQITINQYNPSNLTSPVATYTHTDTETTLQNVSGAWGLGFYNSGLYTRAQTAIYSSSGALTSGTLAADLPGAGKTIANLVGTAATGGTSPYSYQLHRSTTNGFTPTWNGGTLVQSPSSGSLGALQDTGLTPGTTYYYVLMAQDSAGSPATVSSGQVAITTYASNTVILGIVGDSLSYGAHASASAPSAGNVDNSYSPASQFCFMANANQDLNNYIAYNMAVSGSETGNDSTGWYPGTAYYNAAIAVFAKAQVTDILFMLGTNDARVGTSAATYRSNVAAICAALLAVGSIARVHLNFSPYDRSGGANEALLITYKPQLQSIANGSSIIMGDISAHQDIYDYSINGYNVYYTADYIHFIDPGYVMLAYLWWKAYANLGATAGFRPVALGGGING